MNNGSGSTKAITRDSDNKTNFDRKMFVSLSVLLIFRAFLVKFLCLSAVDGDLIGVEAVVEITLLDNLSQFFWILKKIRLSAKYHKFKLLSDI